TPVAVRAGACSAWSESACVLQRTDRPCHDRSVRVHLCCGSSTPSQTVSLQESLACVRHPVWEPESRLRAPPASLKLERCSRDLYLAAEKTDALSHAKQRKGLPVGRHESPPRRLRRSEFVCHLQHRLELSRQSSSTAAPDPRPCIWCTDH